MVDGDPSTERTGVRRDGGTTLDRAVRDLYGDLRMTPMLHALVDHSTRLVGGMAGTVSVIDRLEGRYRKLAERGVPCRLGQTFPLDEGATGRAVTGRRPVVMRTYDDIRTGHLPPGHPARGGPVAAVPIWWRGDVIGVNVTFVGPGRVLSAADVDALDVLTQTAAGALITAGAHDPSLVHVLRDHAPPPAGRAAPRTMVTEVGRVRPVPAPVADAVVATVGSAELAAGRSDVRLHVAIVYGSAGLRLLVQQEGAPPEQMRLLDQRGPGGRTSPTRWRELLAIAGGAADVEHVPGWGTLLRADIPYDRDDISGGAGGPAALLAPAAAPGPQEKCALTPREAEVLALVARGRTDREIAERLVISARTVEKHVGAARRKTGATSRTAAVMYAAARGWLADDRPDRPR